jgi:hypothetical protein
MDQEKWKQEVTFAVTGLSADARKNLGSALTAMAIMDSKGDYDAEYDFYVEKAGELGKLVREIASKRYSLLAGQDCPFEGDEDALITWIFDNVDRLALSPTADVLIHKAAAISSLRHEVLKIVAVLDKIAIEKRAKRAAAG